MAVRASLALGVVAWTAETLDLVNTRAYVVELNPVVTFWVVQIAGNLAAAVLVIALRMLRLLANSESGKETKRWSWGEKVAIGLLVIHPLLSLAVPLMPADVFRQVLLREAPTEVRVVSELVILILVLAARRGAASASRRAA
jgi:hypothetical protein